MFGDVRGPSGDCGGLNLHSVKLIWVCRLGNRPLSVVFRPPESASEVSRPVYHTLPIQGEGPGVSSFGSGGCEPIPRAAREQGRTRRTRTRQTVRPAMVGSTQIRDGGQWSCPAYRGQQLNCPSGTSNRRFGLTCKSRAMRWCVSRRPGQTARKRTRPPGQIQACKHHCIIFEGDVHLQNVVFAKLKKVATAGGFNGRTVALPMSVQSASNGISITLQKH